MITIQEFKDSLGKEADGLTEEQIVKLKDQMEQMAEIYFNMWLSDMNSRK